MNESRSFPRMAHVGNVKTVNANGVWQVTEDLCDLFPEHSEVWHFTRSVTRVTVRHVRHTTVFDLPVRGLPLGFGGRVQWLTPTTRMWLSARASKIDCLHLHSVMQPDHLRVRNLGIPYLVTPHSGYNATIYRGHPAKRLWRRAFDTSVLHGAEAVHTLSDAESQEVQSIAPRAVVRQLAYPVKIGSVRPLLRYDPTGPFLFIGRLNVMQKGLDRLLDGYAVYAGETDVPRPLVLCGPDDRGDRRVLEERTRSLRLQRHVRFLPAVDRDARDELLADAAAFVHTSRWEGQPLAPHEALLAGLPLIVTPETHMGDLVSTARAGFVCDAKPDAIAAALHQFDGLSGAQRVAMGRRGQEAVRTAFHPAAMTAAWGSLYRRVAFGDPK